VAAIKPETVLAWHRAGFRPVVQVVQLESPLERLSDCRTVPYLRFFLVRNEEAGGSNPLSSTRFQKKRPRVCQTIFRSGLSFLSTPSFFFLAIPPPLPAARRSMLSGLVENPPLLASA